MSASQLAPLRGVEIYLIETATQCHFAVNAVRGASNVLSRLGTLSDWDTRRTLHREVFRSAHSFLTHASNVSRMLWPAVPRKKKNERRDAYVARAYTDSRVHRSAVLRAALGLPRAGHVLKSRRLRDHLEHFDERLDKWNASSAHRNFAQDIIGGRNALLGFDPGDVMRWFDPADGQMRFRGEEFGLNAMVDAVDDILHRVADALLRIDERSAGQADHACLFGRGDLKDGRSVSLAN